MTPEILRAEKTCHAYIFPQSLSLIRTCSLQASILGRTCLFWDISMFIENPEDRLQTFVISAAEVGTKYEDISQVSGRPTAPSLRKLHSRTFLPRP